MTREEELQQFAERETKGLYLDKHNLIMMVKAGAKWADSHPHWIPVEERFPEENTTPLVRMDLSDKFNEETIIYDVVVFDQNGFHTPYKVTHWMEIHPPRKE